MQCPKGHPMKIVTGADKQRGKVPRPTGRVRVPAYCPTCKVHYWHRCDARQLGDFEAMRAVSDESDIVP